MTDPLRNITSYQLNGVGKVTQITDAEWSHQVRLRRRGESAERDRRQWPFCFWNNRGPIDLRNRLTSACDALNRCASYTGYDADDNLTQSSNAAHVVQDYKYDNLNRRSENDYDVGGSAASKVQLTYDSGDRLIEAVDRRNGTIPANLARRVPTDRNDTTLASGLDFITEEANANRDR